MFYLMTLESSLAPEDVVAKLRALTMPASGPMWNWRHLFTWDGRRPPEFAGRVNDTSVKLQYLSPFMGLSARPLIDGEIATHGSGTRLRLRIRAIAIDWVMLVLVGNVVVRAIAEEGMTIEITVGLSLFILFGGAWWFAGVRRVRAVFAKMLL